MGSIGKQGEIEPSNNWPKRETVCIGKTVYKSFPRSDKTVLNPLN